MWKGNSFAQVITCKAELLIMPLKTDVRQLSPMPSQSVCDLRRQFVQPWYITQRFEGS